MTTEEETLTYVQFDDLMRQIEILLRPILPKQTQCVIVLATPGRSGGDEGLMVAVGGNGTAEAREGLLRIVATETPEAVLLQMEGKPS